MQIPSEDTQNLAAANAVRTMLCARRRLPFVRIARSLACNTASARNVVTTKTGR